MQRIPIIMAAGLAAAGCASKAPPEINTGLASIEQGRPPDRVTLPEPLAAEPPPASDLDALMRRAALDTQRALEELNRPPPSPEQSPAESAAASMPRAGLLDVTGEGVSPEAGGPAAPTPPDPAVSGPAEEAPAPERTPEERLNDSIDALATLLREQAAAGNLRAHLALAGLELIRVQDTGPAASGLTPGQAGALEAFRGVVAALGSIADLDDGSAALADRLAELAADLEARQPLRITRAELCTRVTGFGRYAPFVAARFPAGRGQRAIVYVEVDRFAQRELGSGDTGHEPGDRYLVELSQELNLYNESGSLLALRHPEQKVVETSRNLRRDFYLVSEIALPPTLSVGRYNLKITMRDKGDGAVAETVIPIDIVADTTTARAPG